MRRNYSFTVTTVRFTGEQPCEAAGGPLSGLASLEPGATAPAANTAHESQSISAKIRTLLKKWFGK